jgi:creatinine amidohydrolase
MEQPLTDVTRGRRGESVDDLMCPRIGAGTAEYECMTWQKIAEEVRRDTPVVISVGASEQHGPHLPVSADWAISRALLRLAAAERHFGGSAAPAGLPLPSRQRWRPAPSWNALA